jgi:predicted DNA-binding transcriptional regulator YafY
VGKSSFLEKKIRLDRLVGLLKSADAWTTSELRDAIGVSQRTLMRDLRELESIGVAIESDFGRGGGVRVKRNWNTGKLELSQTEILDLLVALTTMEKLRSPILMQNLKSIRQKISLLFSESDRKNINELRKRILIGDRASDQVVSSMKSKKSEVLKCIQDSFFGLYKVKIKYRDEKQLVTTRIIEPHYFIYNFPVWYIYSWDQLRTDMRLFRLDRVISCDLTKETFVLRDKTKFEESLRIFFDSV